MLRRSLSDLGSRRYGALTIFEIAHLKSSKSVEFSCVVPPKSPTRVSKITIVERDRRTPLGEAGRSMAGWFGHRQTDADAMKGSRQRSLHGQAMPASDPQWDGEGGPAGSEDAGRAILF